MEVWLKNPWFVGGQRFRRSVNKEDLRTIPDKFYGDDGDGVPTTAKVIVGPDNAVEPLEDKLDPADVATRAFKEAAHAYDGNALPAGMDDGGAASAAMTALANPVEAQKQFNEGKPEYTQLQDRAKALNLKYVGVSKDNLKATIEAAENSKETE